MRESHPSLKLLSAVISRRVVSVLVWRGCWEQALRGPWVNLSMLLIHWAINIAGDFVIRGPQLERSGFGLSARWESSERILSKRTGTNTSNSGERDAARWNRI